MTVVGASQILFEHCNNCDHLGWSHGNFTECDECDCEKWEQWDFVDEEDE